MFLHTLSLLRGLLGCRPHLCSKKSMNNQDNDGTKGKGLYFNQTSVLFH